MLARKLDLENRKMKKALVESCGIPETEIDSNDERTVIEKMRKLNGKPTLLLKAETIDDGFSTDIIGDDVSFYTPPFQRFSSTSESQVRYQDQLPSPISVSEHTPPSSLFTLVARPPSDVLSNESQGPQRLSDLLQLVPTDEAVGLSTVTCYVSYDVLKSLIEERNPANSGKDHIHSEFEPIAECGDG